jgi:DNA polymerase-3 subunit delta'
MVDGGRLPHAILFHQNDGGGAFPLILDFLEYLYGGNPRVRKLIHPDVHYVFPVAGPDKPVSLNFIAQWREFLQANPYFFENELYAALGIEGKQGTISVHEARSVLDRLSLSAVEGGYRTVVVYLPEKMNVQSANSLLKMVEEPPEKTLFLLVTQAPEKVLTTIYSRCVFMRLRPLSREEFLQVHPSLGESEAEYATLFHDLIQQVLSKDMLGALETADAIAGLSSREKQKAFCKYSAEALRNVFLLQQGLGGLSDMREDEKEFFADVAARSRKTFPRMAIGELDRTVMLIERNVSQKILFCDLVCRLISAQR